MMKILFTLDYEIFGNGDGCPNKLMVKPTRRLLDLFEPFGAKLTIMAEVAQMMKFRDFLDEKGRDDYYFTAITDQLKQAIATRHDVQLHVHPSYLNAVYQDGKWKQDWSEYNLASLDYTRIFNIIQTGKGFLNDLLKPVNPDYECQYFRSANWSMSPSQNIVRALVENGFLIDTSVFKYGKRKGLVTFDYSSAWHACLPWPVNEKDVNQIDSSGKLMEFPIYCEQRPLTDFISMNRLLCTYVGKRHTVQNVQKGYFTDETAPSPGFVPKYKNMFKRQYPLKMDFNQCTGRQMIGGLENAWKACHETNHDVPFVLIGHSKSYNTVNQIELTRFLKYIVRHSDRFSFATFGDFDLAKFQHPTLNGK